MFEVTEKAKEMVRAFLQSKNRSAAVRILPWSGE
jgi:hypothetical protein